MKLSNQIIAEFLNQFTTEYHFDPRNQYCLLTGDLVSVLTPETFSSILSDIAVSSDSVETLMDDFALRYFASMRISPRWIKIDKSTLVDLLKSSPKALMAYLLIRMMKPVSGNRNELNFSLVNENSILTRAVVDSWNASSPAFNNLLVDLLELDAKVQLNQIGWTMSGRTFFNSAFSPEQVATLIEPIYCDQIERWKKSVLEAKYLVMNPRAREAFFAKTFESEKFRQETTNRWMERLIREDEKKRKSEKRKIADRKKAIKLEAEIFWDSLADSLLGDSDVPAPSPAPIVLDNPPQSVQTFSSVTRKPTKVKTPTPVVPVVFAPKSFSIRKG